MKTTTLFLLIASMLVMHADDFTARDGKVYKNFKVLSHDDGFITILYADGGGKVPLSNLPDAMQKQYGYDPAKATAALKASAAEEQSSQAKLAAEHAALNDQRVKSQAPATTAIHSQGSSSQATVDIVANENRISTDQQKLDDLKVDLKVAQKDADKDSRGPADERPTHVGADPAERVKDLELQIAALTDEIARLHQQDGTVAVSTPQDDTGTARRAVGSASHPKTHFEMGDAQ